jgi:uncharacterized protein YcfJ
MLSRDHSRLHTMNHALKTLLLLSGIGLATTAPAQATFYEHDGFGGRRFTVNSEASTFGQSGFNDRASSVVIVGNPWEVCQDVNFGGSCVVLRPGRYASLGELGLNDRISSARRMQAGDDKRPPPMAEPEAQVTFFEGERFDGRSFTTTRPVNNLRRFGFNDRASSAVVLGGRWEVCDDSRFRGNCTVLRRGRYPSLAAMGLGDRVSSVRALERRSRVDDNRYAPEPAALYDGRRRRGEQTFDAPITSSRAVLATSGQRCWVESERVPEQRGRSSTGGAIAGAIIGGILGHQVGGGSGKDAATVGGAVVGAVVGSQVGRDGSSGGGTQDVQRCENVPGGAQPAFWDVSYNFRGQDHRVQLAQAPGRTLTVNAQGEPRE